MLWEIEAERQFSARCPQKIVKGFILGRVLASIDKGQAICLDHAVAA